jgi:hypothetical protein
MFKVHPTNVFDFHVHLHRKRLTESDSTLMFHDESVIGWRNFDRLLHDTARLLTGKVAECWFYTSEINDSMFRWDAPWLQSGAVGVRKDSAAIVNQFSSVGT